MISFNRVRLNPYRFEKKTLGAGFLLETFKSEATGPCGRNLPFSLVLQGELEKSPVTFRQQTFRLLLV